MLCITGSGAPVASAPRALRDATLPDASKHSIESASVASARFCAFAARAASRESFLASLFFFSFSLFAAKATVALAVAKAIVAQAVALAVALAVAGGVLGAGSGSVTKELTTRAATRAARESASMDRQQNKVGACVRDKIAESVSTFPFLAFFVFFVFAQNPEKIPFKLFAHTFRRVNLNRRFKPSI